jgi:stage V sporulation protein D (sporulation-specific penicillin-binding protein)
MIQLALAMGKETFYNYLDMFGITQATGVDLPGEASAIIKDPANLSRVDLATMSFGQGVAVTPIQLLTAVNAIGNNGVVMKPRIALNLTDDKGNVVQEFKTEEVRQVMSEKTADEMKDIMRFVVNKGGATNAKIEGYDIGGKTGTANKAAGGGYSEQVISSFIGMAPMDDPQVAILVIVDNPKGVKYGSSTAAPGAKLILEDTLRYMDLNPKYTEEEKKEMGNNQVAVPDVIGEGLDEAIGILGGEGLEYEASGGSLDNDFIVRDQYPKPGQKIEKGGTVYLYRE